MRGIYAPKVQEASCRRPLPRRNRRSPPSRARIGLVDRMARPRATTTKALRSRANGAARASNRSRFAAPLRCRLAPLFLGIDRSAGKPGGISTPRHAPSIHGVDLAPGASDFGLDREMWQTPPPFSNSAGPRASFSAGAIEARMGGSAARGPRGHPEDGPLAGPLGGCGSRDPGPGNAFRRRPRGARRGRAPVLGLLGPTEVVRWRATVLTAGWPSLRGGRPLRSGTSHFAGASEVGVPAVAPLSAAGEPDGV